MKKNPRKSLESLLVKTDAVDSKTATSQSNDPTEITNIDTNICIEIANTDTNIRSETSQIQKTIDSYKEHTNTFIREMNFKFTNTEESQEFISKKYDKQKTKFNQLAEDNKKLQQENISLHSRTNNIDERVLRNKDYNNQLGHYTRSSWMLELAMIPVHENKNCVDIISKGAEVPNIHNFSEDQTDVAHRTSPKPTAVIIILFVKKKRPKQLL